MNEIKTVRDTYPELPPKDRELFRTLLTLSMIFLKGVQEQAEIKAADIQHQKGDA